MKNRGAERRERCTAGGRAARYGLRPLLLSCLAFACASLVLAAPAFASKEPIFSFGTASGTGSLGGQFNTSRDIATNRDGAGPADAGDIYVVDEVNNRIQRFDENGEFISAWGADVIQAGKSGDLPGTNPYEICTVAEDCKAGVASAGNGATSGNGAMSKPVSLAVDNDTGNVYVSDRENRRIDVYDGAGAFIRSFGFAVDTSVAGSDYEVCPAADVCGVGGAGTGTGQYSAGTTANSYGLAISPPDGDTSTGTVFFADTGAQRVNTYNLDGSSPSSFGSATNFGSTQPRKVAVDSRGIVYASDSNNANEIDRYDSLDANGGGTVFLPSIASPPLLAGPAGTATAGIAVDPDSDGAGPDKDVLYVLRDPSTGNTVAQQYGPVNDPGLATAPTAVDDSHGNAAGFGAVNGFGIDDGTGHLFVSATTNIAGTGAGHRVYVLGDSLPAPAPTMNPVTVKSDTTATFAGTVNPQGGQVSCEFEYSTDQSAWTPVPAPACGSLAVAGGAQAVSLNVTGLVANTHYFVRLAVRRTFLANSTVFSTPKAFDTSSVPPVVSDIGAVEVVDTSARLVGTIDPKHAPTGYVFQYGTTPALGSSTAPVGIGDGSYLPPGPTSIIVSQIISGLSPSTTYYFRLVATNVFGLPTVSDSDTFVTKSAATPPGDRAYEQVTPHDKNFGLLTVNSAIARDGEAASFCDTSGNGEPPSEVGFVCAGSVAYRGSDGWRSTSLVWPYCADGQRQFGTGNITPDFSSVIIKPSCLDPVLGPTGPLSSEKLYLASPPGSPGFQPGFESLTPVSSTLSTEAFGDSTDDGGRIFYTSPGAQVTGAPAVSSLYEWHEGTVSLVSKKPDGTDFTTPSSLPSPTSTVNPISAAGTSAFFQNAPLLFPPSTFGPSELYLRENGTTFKVSEKECAISCTSDAGTFEWATANDDKALFLSTAKLTEDDSSTSGNDLYLFTQGANPAAEPHNLTLLSRDNEPADGTAAGVLGVSGISSDGNTVFFVAEGQILAGEPTAAGPKVYRWRWNGGSPAVQYLATLDPSAPGGNNNLDRYAWRNKTLGNTRPDDLIVSADGRRMILQTVKPLDPVADTDSDVDVYRWDEQEGWNCLSCQRPGTTSAGASLLEGGVASAAASGVSAPVSVYRQRIVMVDEGKRIFFTTADSLVPADTNNGRRDVYEWDDGALSLITSGGGVSDGSEKDNLLVGASASGRDVFFITSDRLVGWDTDGSQDLYDARVGGGFPEPPPAPPSCEAEGCRGPGTSALPAPAPGTPNFQGPGNQAGPVTCPKGTRRTVVKGRVVCKKTRKRGKHKSHKNHRRHDHRRAGSNGGAGK